MDYIRIILNLGRYQFRIVESVPDWAANQGEAVVYTSGNIRRLYVYIYGRWDYIGWDSEGNIDNAGKAGAVWDADEDTGMQVEESTDEDIIRFDTGDTAGGATGERATIDYLGIAITAGIRVTLDGRGGNTYLMYDTDHTEIWADGTQVASATTDQFAVESGLKLGLEGYNGDTYWKYNSTTDYMEGWIDGNKRVDL